MAPHVVMSNAIHSSLAEQTSRNASSGPKHVMSTLVLALLVGGLYALSQINYLLFHAVVELTSIAIAVAIFMLAWNARTLMNNEFLLFIGFAYFLVSFIDLFHTLAYDGMGVFPWADTNLPTQLWIAARMIKAAALLAAPLLLWRKLRARIPVIILTGAAVIMLISIFRDQLGWTTWPAFPVCFVKGTGLTPFKIYAEYVICAVFTATLGVLIVSRRKLDPGVFRYICLAIIVTIASELAFTEYANVYGFANILGHILKIVAYYLIYKAIVETGLAQPYRIIFRELDQRVQERTTELSQTVEALQGEVRGRIQAEKKLLERSEQLRALASQLTLAEQRERRRLAQVLHDDLQQFLVGAKFLLNPLQGSSDIKARKTIAEVQNAVDQAIKCSRNLTMELSPPVLHEFGLAGALEWLAGWMRKSYGLNVHLDADEEEDSQPEDIKVLLFHSVRELLFNIAKHAQTKTARVQIRRLDDHIEVTIADDGVGFDPEVSLSQAGKVGGFGLLSIRERAELLGGTLKIHSAPGQGSHFTLVVPCHGAN